MRMKFPQAFIFIFQLSSTSVLPPFVPHFVLKWKQLLSIQQDIWNLKPSLYFWCKVHNHIVEIKSGFSGVRCWTAESSSCNLNLFFKKKNWTVNYKDEFWDVTTEVSVQSDCRRAGSWKFIWKQEKQKDIFTIFTNLL